MADYSNNYKTRDYTLRGGKDAAISNERQRMAKGQYQNKQDMVKEEQAKLMKYQGKIPVAEERYYKFDACMTNNGTHAQELAKDLTTGIDSVAFPVRQKVDPTQT